MIVKGNLRLDGTVAVQLETALPIVGKSWKVGISMTAAADADTAAAALLCGVECIVL